MHAVFKPVIIDAVRAACRSQIRECVCPNCECEQPKRAALAAVRSLFSRDLRPEDIALVSETASVDAETAKRTLWALRLHWLGDEFGHPSRNL